jgi:hypothetical protein
VPLHNTRHSQVERQRGVQPTSSQQRSREGDKIYCAKTRGAGVVAKCKRPRSSSGGAERAQPQRPSVVFEQLLKLGEGTTQTEAGALGPPPG